ncbi:MAG: tRNA-dihydrouridine synthase family protein [Bacteroidaceae bacterium]|nr:tRNA-dihydrouridine synthase family protein [Bacteroidaceae bacterium]
MLPIYFAPLQGYTDDVYRRTHHDLVGGVAAYYTPFVRMEAGSIRSKDMRDINPENNVGTPVIPQIIFNSCKEFEYLVNRVEALGYKQMDLNMGCPFPLQAKHGRGVGILANEQVMDDIIEGIKSHSDIKFSVKMRLGWDDNTHALNVVRKLNSVEIEHVTIHPRTGAQQYKGCVDLDSFAALYQECENPIIYNGDLRTADDIHKIEELFPKISGIMIGRGLLGRPSLAKEYNENREINPLPLLIDIHDALMQEYSRILKGDTQMLNKMHTFWDFSQDLMDRKTYKKIVKSGNMKNYLAAVNAIRIAK